jgi:parallel beta-helix repeat protein
MKRSLFYLLTALFVSLLPSFVAAEVKPAAFVCESYSGALTANTSWSPTECPDGYRITGNVLVGNGVTLTILPGTLVQFDANPTLTINGTLVARGTAASPIRFTSSAASPAAGAWKNIVFNDESADATYDSAGNYSGGSILEYATIEYGGATNLPAVSLAYTSPFFNQVTVQDNAEDGIGGYVDSELRISDSTFRRNGASGLNLTNGNYTSQGPLMIVLNGTSSEDNGRFGVSLTSYREGSTITIVDSTVNANGYIGIDINRSLDLSVTISGSTISGNLAGGLDIKATRVDITGTTITGNTGNAGYPIYASGVGGLNITDNSYYNVLEGVVRGNSISDNAAYSSAYAGGLEVKGAVVVSGNTISGNTIGGGVWARSSGPIINDNNISGNLAGETPEPRNLISSPYSASDPALDAKNNWWGTTSIATIDSGIFDYSDDTDYNPVVYEPIRSAAVYLVSGQVKDSSGKALSDVTISAGSGRSATTDISGYYFLSGLPAGSYTLSAARSGYSFTPTTRNVTVNANLSGQDFVGAQTSFSIRGRIVVGEEPLTNATVSASNGSNSASATTDADGNFEITGLAAGSYSVVPTLAGYVFTPTQRSAAVPPDANGQDFSAALQTYTISGAVRTITGDPLQGILISAGGGRSATTDANGAYSFTNLQEGDYTLTPTSFDYTFDPPTIAVTVGPDAPDQDFTALTSETGSLTGRVADRSGNALQGVVITNGQGRTATTDGNGIYRFEDLTQGYYTLEPQLSGYYFAPRARRTAVVTDTIGINFVGDTATTSGPSLLINYPTGRPGSFFTVVGRGYPASQSATILSNGTSIGNVQIDGLGSFSFILATASQAQPGQYRIEVRVETAATQAVTQQAVEQASSSIELVSDETLRPMESSADDPEVDMPASIEPEWLVYLPLVRR